jgi:glutamate formiminotransferase/formiminotetrahydrofolate cyclodeaminase
MSQALVECIPNFSDGRRQDVIDAISREISSVPGVHVLDRHSDADHNRTVISFAGAPEAVSQAAFAAIARAAKLIDLDQQRGEHPRIGATDVVPFVPLAGFDMAKCVELARSLGRRVADELAIPVYLYEAAATRPDRVNLENLRRGEYEGLKESIAGDPARAPDFGPKRLGKAGATVIGAHAPLIAYNVYLTSGDVEIAKKVARAVRQSSGGLRYVKALGMLVEGRAQVSMNLTDFTHTPLARVVELVRREAARYGVGVQHAELVGLIPQSALFDAAQWYLQLDDFKHDQVLETRLFAAFSADQDVAFLDRLAAGSPTPGGGSAAAYAGAMAAGLVAMVARLTQGKKKYAAVELRMNAIVDQAEHLRKELEAAVAADSRAFEDVLAAMRLPNETDQEKAKRSQTIEQSSQHAAAVPLATASHAVEALELAAEVAANGNLNAASDAASAGALARAALTAAAMNVRVNAASIQDRAAAASWAAELSRLEAGAAEAEKRLQQALGERVGITG